MTGSNVRRSVPPRGVSVRGTACARQTPGGSPGTPGSNSTAQSTTRLERVRNGGNGEAYPIAAVSIAARWRLRDRRYRRTVGRVDDVAQRVRENPVRRGARMEAVERERPPERTAHGHRVACIALWEVRERPHLRRVLGELRELRVHIEICPVARAQIGRASC